jgi:hypothetical protein
MFILTNDHKYYTVIDERNASTIREKNRIKKKEKGFYGQIQILEKIMKNYKY